MCSVVLLAQRCFELVVAGVYVSEHDGDGGGVTSGGGLEEIALLSKLGA